MNPENRPSQPTRIPNFFYYRNMVCRLINISPTGESLEFELLPIQSDKRKIDLLSLAERLPEDIVFKMLVSFIYGRCCTNIVTRIVMDEEKDETSFFIHCTSCANEGMIVNFNNYGLFTQAIGRFSTSAFESTVPFTIPNVHYIETDESVDVKGIVTVSIERQSKYFNLIRYLHIYGCNVTVSITNIKDVRKVIPNYVPFNHNSIFSTVIDPALSEQVSKLMCYLDPVAGLDLNPKYTVAYDSQQAHYFSDNQSYTFRIILNFQTFNGMEIQNITPYNVIFKPKDDEFITKYLVEHGPNQFLKNRISRMCTALLSDTGCLFVPEVQEIRTQFESGNEYLVANLKPRVVSFADDGNIAAFGEGFVNLENIGVGAFWLKSNCSDPFSQVEMLFPFFGNVDANTLAFIRMPIGMPCTSYTNFAEMYTSSMITMDMCAEDSLYVYWRLYREEWNRFSYPDINKAIPDPFIIIDEDLSEDISHAAGENETALQNILMTLASSENLSSVFEIMDQRDPDFKKLKEDDLRDLKVMIQKVFAAYGTAINAGNDKEFLTLYGEAGAKAMRNILSAVNEEMQDHANTLKNVKDTINANIRAEQRPAAQMETTSDQASRDEISKQVQDAIDDLHRPPQPIKKKKGFFSGLFN